MPNESTLSPTSENGQPSDTTQAMLPNPASPGSTTRRIVELDSLRALAAINLLLFHFTHVYSVKYGYTSPLGFEFAWGKYGVQLFFMLSGLVNAMTLMKKRQPGEFLASRFIRIFPSFWLVMLVNLALLLVLPLSASHVTPDQFAANMTVMPNLFGYSCIEPVTWTLQVEILFYAVLLFLFISGQLRTPVRTVGLVLLLSLAVCLPLKMMPTVAHSAWGNNLAFLNRIMILEFLPLFTIGILINEIKNKRGKVWLNATGIVASAVVFHAIDQHGHNPVITVGMIGLLGFSAFGKFPPLRFRPLVYVSAISYSLYLMHNNLGCTLIYHLNQNGVSPLLSMILATIAMIIVSSVATFYIERPISNALRWCWVRIRKVHWIDSLQTKLNERVAAF